MKIETKIHALLASGFLLLALVGSVMFVANRDITADRQAIQATEQLMRSATELRLFGFETILFRNSRSADQWQRKIRSIHGELQALEIVQPAARVKLERIRRNIESANAIYADLQHRPAPAANAKPFNTAEEAAFAARSFAALTLMTQDVIDSAIDLNRESRNEEAQSWRVITIAVVLMLLAMLAQLVFMWRLTRGSILRPLATLVGATQRIATGDYTVRLNLPQGDEIGTLASAFNAMSVQVQLTTETLRREEENLAITVNSIGDAVIATDAQGRITRMNPMAERLTAWPLADALGQPLTEVFHIISAETRLPSVNPVQLVMESGTVVGLANHTALLARDGKEYQIADSAAPIRNDAGEIVGVVLVFSDVTEKYRVHEALRETQAMLARTEEIGKVGGWEFDIDTRQQTWTKAVYDIHEVEFTGRPTVEQGINFYTAESRPIIEQAVQRAIEQGEPFDLELEIITAKGNPRNVHTIGRADSVRRKIFGFFQDITERKQADLLITQSERRLELAVGGAGLGLWDWHVATGELTVNDRWRSMLGLDPAGPMPTIDLWNSLVHVDDLPNLDQLFKDVIMNPTGRNFEIEIRARHRDGHYLWIFDKGHVAERAADGSPLRVVGIHLDISESKHAALLLAESESQRLAEISAALKVQAQSSRTALSLMEDAVAARQQAESLSVTLTEQLDELRRWQQATLNRESRILSVKKEVNALLAAQGQPPRYPSALDEGAEK